MKRSFFFLLVLYTGCVLISPFLGGESLTFANLGLATSPDHRIFFDLRIPRCLLTLVAGGSLAMLGATYQILFQNPLAEPYILGVSSAATLGVAIAEMSFGIAAYSLPSMGAGFVTAMGLTALLIALCLSHWGRAMDRIILFGMGMNFLLSSGLFLLLSYFHQQMGGGSLRWLFGQIPWVSPNEALLFAGVSLPFLVGLWVFGRHLDALSMGDQVARTLGFSPIKTRTSLLLVTSAFLAILVAFTGSIGFVGLVVPHAVKLAFRPPTSRWLFTLCFLVGSLFLLASDILSRVMMPPLEFPIGIVTTILGGPAFLWLLWRRP